MNQSEPRCHIEDASSRHVINVTRMDVVLLHPSLAKCCPTSPAGRVKLHSCINGQHVFPDASIIIRLVSIGDQGFDADGEECPVKGCSSR